MPELQRFQSAKVTIKVTQGYSYWYHFLVRI